MTRLATALVALLAIAAIAAGCGDSSSGSAEEALTYLPKDTPFAIAVDTDPDGEQWQNADALLKKFPGSGAIKARIEQSLSDSADGKVDFEDDIKPILGNDFVIAALDPRSLQGGDSDFVGAMKVEDEDKLRDLLEAGDAKKEDSIAGADVYSSGEDSFFGVEDGVVVVASAREDLEAALKRHDDDSGMTESDFDALTGGVDDDALFRVGFDVEQTLAGSPEAATAKKVKWVGALRDAGFAVSVEDDGIAYEFEASTDGGLTEADLPLAAGDDPPQVVRNAGEIAVGIRNLTQTIHFAEQVAQITDPAEFAKYTREKARVGRLLGIDVDRDFFDQLDGNATFSIAPAGDVAFRATLKDPEAFAATLRKAAPRARKLRPGTEVSKLTGSANGLYQTVQPDGDRVTFGVVGDSFVSVTGDAARVTQVAGQSLSDVPGAKGSLAVVFDARTLVNDQLERRGQSAAQLVTGALGDFVGSVESETDGLSGRFKLNVK